MNIVATNQQFAVYGHSELHSGRLERRPHQAASLQFAATSPQTSAANVLPEPRLPLSKTTLAEQKANEQASPESTSSAAQNEDKQSFNDLQPVDAVERILDQLSTGKLLSWIDGNSMEKIQAQLSEQQAASAVVRDIPAFSAQSIAVSFGLDDNEALLSRIARSGIFLDGQNPIAVFDNDPELHQVDLNI